MFFLFILVSSTILTAQNADFETVSFELKPIAMITAERSLLSYDFAKDEIPSRFTKASLSRGTIQQLDNSPLIYVTREKFANKNITPVSGTLEAPTLSANQVYAFTNDGSISSPVKNIAYKRATGGNIADAYCNALYAARAEGRQ